MTKKQKKKQRRVDEVKEEWQRKIKEKKKKRAPFTKPITLKRSVNPTLVFVVCRRRGTEKKCKNSSLIMLALILKSNLYKRTV